MRWGPSSLDRSGSLAGDPIMNSPAGTTTISGQSAQSRKLLPEPGATPSAGSRRAASAAALAAVSSSARFRAAASASAFFCAVSACCFWSIAIFSRRSAATRCCSLSRFNSSSRAFAKSPKYVSPKRRTKASSSGMLRLSLACVQASAAALWRCAVAGSAGKGLREAERPNSRDGGTPPSRTARRRSGVDEWRWPAVGGAEHVVTHAAAEQLDASPGSGRRLANARRTGCRPVPSPAVGRARRRTAPARRRSRSWLRPRPTVRARRRQLRPNGLSRQASSTRTRMRAPDRAFSARSRLIAS